MAGLRAVVFDYGMVLTGPPDPEAHAAMLRLTGLPLEQFERLYWADRPAYDTGDLTGLAFWQKLVRRPASLSATKPSTSSTARTPACGPRKT